MDCHCIPHLFKVLYVLYSVLLSCMLFAELWEGLVSRLQQQRLSAGLERITIDNISPFKLFGLSLVSVVLSFPNHCTYVQIHCA